MAAKSSEAKQLTAFEKLDEPTREFILAWVAGETGSDAFRKAFPDRAEGKSNAQIANAASQMKRTKRVTAAMEALVKERYGDKNAILLRMVDHIEAMAFAEPLDYFEVFEYDKTRTDASGDEETVRVRTLAFKDLDELTPKQRRALSGLSISETRIETKMERIAALDRLRDIYGIEGFGEHGGGSNQKVLIVPAVPHEDWMKLSAENQQFMAEWRDSAIKDEKRESER